MLGASAEFVILLGFAASATVGGLIGHLEGTVVAAFVYSVAALLWAGARDEKLLPARITGLVDAVDARVGELIEGRVLSPMALALTGAARVLPWRLRGFLVYGGEALVLKRFHGEIEFAHRRLRDYFALRELAPRLESCDTNEKHLAIESLGFQGAAAIDTLADLIVTGDVNERLIAVAALGRISAPEVAAYLERAITQNAPEVRCAATHALGNLPNDDRHRLLSQALKDPDAPVRLAAFEEALRSKDVSFVKAAVIGVLVNESTFDVVRRAVSSMDIGQQYSMDSIGSALPGSTKPLLLRLLGDESPKIRLNVCRLMSGNKEIADVEEIARTLGNDPDSEVRAAAAAALGGLIGNSRHDPRMMPVQDQIVDLLRTAVNDSTAIVRQGVAIALGAATRRPALDALIGMSSDEEASVRVAVAATLRTFWNPEATSTLIKMLEDQEASVRKAAAEAFSIRKDAAAVPALLNLLNDAEASVRERAVDAIAYQGEIKAVGLIISALKDKNESVRVKAATALGALGDPVAEKPLVKAAKDRRSVIRAAAVRALGTIGGAEALPLVTRACRDKSLEVRRAAADALGSLRQKSSVPHLIEMLDDPEARVRVGAAEALSEINDAKAVMPLLVALAREKDEFWAKYQQRAISKLSDADAVQVFISALSDENTMVRRLAAEALGDIGDARAYDSLERLLDGTDKELAGAAASALSKLRETARTRFVNQSDDS
jgi:HEAT repeat protein